MRARRASLPAEDRRARSLAAARLTVDLLERLGGSPVAAFVSLPDEIDTGALVEWLLARDGAVLLPRQEGPGRALALHRWRTGEPLERGRFGVREPLATAPLARPAIVVVPLLAVDRRGFRLGYGAGYYDRTLAALARSGTAPTSVGLAFALQRVPEVPVEPTDVPLDWLVTEEGAERFENMGRTPE